MATSKEYLVQVGSVALAGVVSLGTLGGAMALAVDGGTRGEGVALSGRGAGSALVGSPTGGALGGSLGAGAWTGARARGGAPFAAVGVEAATVTSLAHLAGQFERLAVAPIELLRRYKADPAEALAALPADARAYLEAEVLPILRTTGAVEEADGDKVKTLNVRHLPEEYEGDVLTEIVSGHPDRAQAAFEQFRQQEWDLELPDDLAEVIEFAANRFPDYWSEGAPGTEVASRLLRFSRREAAELVRVDGSTLEALRAREAGGSLMADTVEAARRIEFERRPGRPEGLDQAVLERWLRAAARGEGAEFGEARSLMELTVRDELPEAFLEHLELVLQKFQETETL